MDDEPQVLKIRCTDDTVEFLILPLDDLSTTMEEVEQEGRDFIKWAYSHVNGVFWDGMHKEIKRRTRKGFKE